MSRQPVLLLVGDALAAALVAAAVELAGYDPYFAAPGESPRDALRRTRPGAVLVGTGYAEAYSEAFIGPALMTGARVLVVRSPRPLSRDPTLAERLRLTVLDLPDDLERLLALLGEEGG